MVGRRLDEQFPHVPHTQGEPLLELRDLVGQRLPNGASLTLHRGEILGLAGVVGAGRTELLRAVFGLDPVRGGRILVRSVEGRVAGPRRRIAQGLGMLSEDRKGEGLALPQSIADNLTYSRLGPYTWCGWLRLGSADGGGARLAGPPACPLRRPGTTGRRAVRRQSAEGGAGSSAASGGRHRCCSTSRRAAWTSAARRRCIA